MAQVPFPSCRGPAAEPRRARARVALTALALACAAVLAGCGSGHGSGTSAAPAVAVPASAALYAEALVRPEGAEKADALAVGRSLAHGANPYLALLGALQTPGSPRPGFNSDVARWLGPRAGIFLTSTSGSGALLKLAESGLLGAASSAAGITFGSEGLQGALVMDTSDVSAARSFLEAAARRAGAHARSYRGVGIRSTDSGLAFAVVDRYAVIGSEAALHSVIDTVRGGPALAHAAGYAKLASDAPAGAIAHLYSSPGAGGAAAPSGMLALLSGSREANISLVPAAGSATLDADTLLGASTGAAGGLLSSISEGAPALAQLPAGSWLAVGLSHLGQTLGQDAAGVEELASLVASPTAPAGGGGLVSLESLIAAVVKPLQALGADTASARADFTSWMGSGGIFASGAGLLELKAAVVIESNDPARSKAAVGELAAALRAAGDSTERVSLPGTEASAGVRVTGLPLILYIADGRGSDGRAEFVLGLGEASVTAALHPSGTLARSAALSADAAHLGEGIKPSVAVEVPTVVGLLESLQLTEEPAIAKLLPPLRAVTTVAAGGRRLGSEVERLALYVGLRAAG